MSTIFKELPNRLQTKENGQEEQTSELTELTGLDEESEEDNDGFLESVDDILPQPVAYSCNARELHHSIHHGAIELNPPWQREVVWSQAKQSQLIDSLFKNFYIPPVVFAQQIDEDGEELRICVDGKQRLTSILQFLDGQLPYKSESGQQWYYTLPESHPGKSKRYEVPKKWKDIFEGKQITCVEFRGLKIGQEREIFQRVQLGVPLTMAEKLAAIASPVALWISELDEKHMSDKGGCLADVIDIELKRGKNFQNMAQFVFCCHEVDSEAFPSGRKFEEFLNQQEELKQNMKKSIDAALQQFARIASDPRLNSAFTELKARVAPVEFVFIAVLLFLMDEASDKEQAYAVYHLREAIRDRFPDLRMRNDVVELMWAYVKALAQEPNNDLCRVAAKSNKRKRKPSSKLRKEDSDTDYKPTRSAKKSRT